MLSCRGFFFFFGFVVINLYKVPCVFAGKLYLNGTSATRIFFTPKLLLERMHLPGKHPFPYLITQI